MFAAPVLTYTIHAVLSSASTIVYYAGTGAWWLTKRAIWGREMTTEERLEHLALQQQHIMQQLDNTATAEEQTQLMTAMQQEIEELRLLKQQLLAAPSNDSDSLIVDE